MDSCCPNSSSFCCNGVRSCSVDAISSRIFPISVCPPVATTTPTARPAAMFVPFENEDVAGEENEEGEVEGEGGEGQ